MGMYTRLQLDVEIYPKFVPQVQEYIEMTPRMQSSSYYFYDRGEHVIEQDTAGIKSIWEPGNYDRSLTAPMQTLHCDISLKNYEDEIAEYLKFLCGKVTHGGGDINEQVGLIRYEQTLVPSLIYCTMDNQLIIKEITLMEPFND